MFGKKKPQIKNTISADFEIIPQEFYGTKDPVVHYQSGQNIPSKSVSKISSSFSLMNLLIVIVSLLHCY